MTKRPVILIADDYIHHTQSLEAAFAEGGVDIRINIVRDGQEALDYLNRDRAIDIFDEFPIPDLLLLDLEMPKMDGFAVLDAIRAQARFKELPIIVLSASPSVESARQAYARGANGYIVKPFSDRDYTSLVEYVKKFLSELDLQ
jgi:CheY-like chemotaxis protein